MIGENPPRPELQRVLDAQRTISPEHNQASKTGLRATASVLVATVSSGAGLGLLLLLAMARLFHAAPASSNWWRALLWAAGLITLGCLAAVTWWRGARSGGQQKAVQTAWLTRTAWAALALYPAGAVYAVLVAGQHRPGEIAVGLLIMAACGLALVGSGIFFMRQSGVLRWQTWHTGIGVPLLGLMTGALLLTAMVPPGAAPVAGRLAVLLLLLGAALKLSYFIRFADDRRAGAAAAGHTTSLLKLAMFVLGFIAPFVLLSLSIKLAAVASGLALAGRLIEQWLFLAEVAPDAPPGA